MKFWLYTFDMEHEMKKRFVDTKLHRVFEDHDEGVFTFPLFELNGQFSGYQQYRPLGEKKVQNAKHGKYYTYRTKNTMPVWGLESWHLSNTLFVTEGLFDTARLTYNGFSAVAVLANNPVQLSSWFYTVRQFRNVVVCCDGDLVGRDLAVYGRHAEFMPDGHDVGSVSEDVLQELLSKYR